VAYLSWTDTEMVRGADRTPGLGDGRQDLPWVFGRTYPLEPAVARMVDGIAARAPHVYAQKWVRALTWFRAAAPTLTAHAPERDAREVERRLREAGPAATLPVGAGGAADEQRRG
jgi:hypothetical protein